LRKFNVQLNQGLEISLGAIQLASLIGRRFKIQLASFLGGRFKIQLASLLGEIQNGFTPRADSKYSWLYSAGVVG
jgi:hypothetical protein